MSKVNVGTRGHIDWGNPNAMRLSADTKKFISDRLIKEPKMNSEKREPWASDRLEAMYQQYISSGALQANPMSRGAIGAYINALEHELRAALSTETQPEVTGAVAWLVVDAKNAHLLDSGQGFLRGDEAYSKDPYWATKPLYPPSAIEAAVREKLEDAARLEFIATHIVSTGNVMKYRKNCFIASLRLNGNNDFQEEADSPLAAQRKVIDRAIEQSKGGDDD